MDSLRMRPMTPYAARHLLGDVQALLRVGEDLVRPNDNRQNYSRMGGYYGGNPQTLNAVKIFGETLQMGPKNHAIALLTNIGWSSSATGLQAGIRQALNGGNADKMKIVLLSMRNAIHEDIDRYM
ncbi:hypothetical protein Ciccas_011722 [Cichlidogyrus casuarinus]|uniref:Uncharacterized protein n=1 Tax=Cichlidogyrus casuarinus TaxID=1844966 RepID=A0ABD2PTF0_9PLAT